MFTGIIQGSFIVKKLEKYENLLEIAISLPSELRKNLQIGASVSVDGVCLTVSDLIGDEVYFNIMQETLNVTTLGSLKINEDVNIERSLNFNSEIGGHLLSGHIDTTAKVLKIEEPANNYIITFSVDSKWMKYIFSKGYVGINGASLTIVNADKASNTFQVYLIPDTLRLTNLKYKKENDFVNLEIDRQTQVIVDTVERILAERC